MKSKKTIEIEVVATRQSKGLTIGSIFTYDGINYSVLNFIDDQRAVEGITVEPLIKKQGIAKYGFIKCPVSAIDLFVSDE